MLRFQSFGNFQGYEGSWGYDRNLLKNLYFGCLSWTWVWSFLIIFKQHICELSCHKKINRGTYSRSVRELTENINPGRGVRLLVWIMARNRGRWPSRAAANVNLRKNNLKKTELKTGEQLWKDEFGVFLLYLTWCSSSPVPRHSYFLKTRVKLLHTMLLLASIEQNPLVFVFLPRPWPDFPGLISTVPTFIEN